MGNLCSIPDEVKEDEYIIQQNYFCSYLRHKMMQEISDAELHAKLAEYYLPLFNPDEHKPTSGQIEFYASDIPSGNITYWINRMNTLCNLMITDHTTI